MVIILFFILIIVLIIEYKFIRPKRTEEIQSAINRDEAYNALVNSTAVSASLKNLGKDTRDADLLLIRAQAEYDRQDYSKVIATTKVARELMINAKDLNTFEPIVGERKESVETEEVKEEDKTVHEVRKLPPNYLESKFMIETTSDEIANAERSGKEVEEAKHHMEEARKCFDDKEYSNSLKACMKARRSLSAKGTEAQGGGGAAASTAPSEAGSAIVSTKYDRIPDEKRTPVMTAPEAVSCKACGKPLRPEDEFCGKCGTPVVKELMCPKCGTTNVPDDLFCRKCGERLR